MNGSPLVARLIRTANPDGVPKLIVQFGWGGCTTAGCPVLCTITHDPAETELLDEDIVSPTHPLKVPGQHALTSHHWDTDFLSVRAGSQ
jgi:hypothetical protein